LFGGQAGFSSLGRGARNLAGVHNARLSRPRRNGVTTNYSDGTAAGAGLPSEPRRSTRRLSTETKASYKTTELFAYLAAVVGVLVASQLIGAEEGHDDYFRAGRAWFYIVLLGIGYMVSRGLAKAGSRDPYDADDRR
jgi:hypothetical protein